MKIQMFKISIICLTLLAFSIQASETNDSLGWQAGVAKIDITPEHPMWMAGYSSRVHEATGALHPLWAKALAVQDEAGNLGVIVTIDILGLPKNMSDKIFEECEIFYGLDRSRIILSSSHTHSGPALRSSLDKVYPTTLEHVQQIDEYSRHLEDQIVQLIGRALKDMNPVTIHSSQGTVDFAVNRRNNRSGKKLPKKKDQKGPYDYTVPVIQIHNPDNMRATVFGYACHATVLNGYDWCGDYPGFAQIEVENMFPGTTAMFFQGCGADQNPLPRRKVSLAEKYGKALASTVKDVIENPAAEISPKLQCTFGYVDLDFATLPDRKLLEKLAADSTKGFERRWAQSMVQKLDAGQPIPQSYPYPVQIWQMGEQTLIALGGEVVVDYAIQLKRMFGENTIVMGYCNDVMAYIPTVQILREGGYEGAQSQIVYDLPSTWTADIESRILSKVLELTDELGIKLPESALLTE